MVFCGSSFKRQSNDNVSASNNSTGFQFLYIAIPEEIQKEAAVCIRRKGITYQAASRCLSIELYSLATKPYN